MRSHRRRGIVRGVFALTVVSALAIVQPPPAATGASDDALAFAGFLLSTEGSPLASARVRLFAERNDRGTRSTDEVPISTTTTSAEGRFAFKADLAALPTDTQSGRELDIFVFSNRGGLAFYTNVHASQDPSTGRWTADEPANALEITQRSRPLGVVYEVGRGMLTNTVADCTVVARLITRLGERAALVATAPGRAVAAPSGETQAAAEGARVAAAPTIRVATATRPAAALTPSSAGVGMPLAVTRQQACLQNGSVTWKSTGATRYAMVPTKLFQNTSRARTEWDLNDTKETTLGVAINNAGQLYSGGLSASYVNETGLGFTSTVGVNKRRMFNVKWQYIQERLWCSDDSAPPGNVMTYNIYRWIPYRETGGNTTTTTKMTTKCGGTGPRYNDPFSQPTRIERSTTATYGGFFSVAGVGLSVQQKTVASEVFRVLPLKGKTAHMCGNNAAPAFATLCEGD